MEVFQAAGFELLDHGRCDLGQDLGGQVGCVVGLVNGGADGVIDATDGRGGGRRHLPLGHVGWIGCILRGIGESGWVVVVLVLVWIRGLIVCHGLEHDETEEMRLDQARKVEKKKKKRGCGVKGDQTTLHQDVTQ